MYIAELAARTLPYTVGDGMPAYRTNPNTGKRFTFEEFSAKAQMISRDYSMQNPYIGDPVHAYDKQG